MFNHEKSSNCFLHKIELNVSHYRTSTNYGYEQKRLIFIFNINSFRFQGTHLLCILCLDS